MPDPIPVSGILQGLIDDLAERASAPRCDVKRTTATEERAPIDRITRVGVYARDGWKCQWCGAAHHLELDHIVPWSAGGSDSPSNLRTLCKSCNEKRSNYAIETGYKPPKFSDGCVSCEPERPWADVFATGRVWCARCGFLSLGPSGLDV
ncbi:HNH endonuclease [Nocardia otitidiscaviarum]|uniref:HNH endonuclease n=1 Tax=Nocardia otitidiscaviarum TaxID=1823 RepID=UPI0009E09854|nr:HNH endonuclease [Nocardia otitidiscaviarum]